MPVCGPLARSSRCKPSAPGDLACYPRRCLGPLHAWRSQTLRSGSRVTIETRGVSAFSRRPRHNQARAAHSGIHHGRRCACVADQNLDFVILVFGTLAYHPDSDPRFQKWSPPVWCVTAGVLVVASLAGCTAPLSQPELLQASARGPDPLISPPHPCCADPRKPT